MGLSKFAQLIAKRELPLDFPGHWIGGKWIRPDRASIIKASYNPSRNKKIADIGLDKNTVALAVEKAYDARNSFPHSIAERLEWLGRFRQMIGDYEETACLGLQIGLGKARWEAEAEVAQGIAFLDSVLSAGGSIEEEILRPVSLGHGSKFKLKPVGVTAAFLPFSVPFTSFVQYFTAAVMSGCPLVVMASSHAVLEAAFFSHIFEAMDLPSGCVNVMTGNFTFLQQALLDNRIQAVIYRGSREHCDMIRKESRALNGRQMMLYSGGKNSLVVQESADMETALRCAIYGAFQSAGQLCSSTSRIFVADSVFKSFTEQFVEAVRNLSIGATDGQEQPFMGPLYSDKAVEKFLRFQTMAKRESQETLLWGKAYDAGTGGYFVSPGVHVVDRVDANKAYQSNVLMSPDVAIYRFNSFDEAIDGANATDAPLVVSIVGDAAAWEKDQPRFFAPNIVSNLPTTAIEHNFPVTGKLHCGHHRVSGLGLIYLLTYPQSVTESTQKRVPEYAWPWPRN